MYCIGIELAMEAEGVLSPIVYGAFLPGNVYA